MYSFQGKNYYNGRQLKCYKQYVVNSLIAEKKGTTLQLNQKM